MKKVIWSADARKDYLNNLQYWKDRNKSDSYSKKIEKSVQELEKQLKDDYKFLSTYVSKLKVYRRLFFKNNSKYRFVVYFDIKEDTIEIVYFRSTSQKPLEE